MLKYMYALPGRFGKLCVSYMLKAKMCLTSNEAMLVMYGPEHFLTVRKQAWQPCYSLCKSAISIGGICLMQVVETQCRHGLRHGF